MILRSKAEFMRLAKKILFSLVSSTNKLCRSPKAVLRPHTDILLSASLARSSPVFSSSSDMHTNIRENRSLLFETKTDYNVCDKINFVGR